MKLGALPTPGSNRHQDLKVARAVLLDGAVKVPRGLPAEGRREWLRVVPILVERGVLSDADLAGLEDYCLCVGRLHECESSISEKGVLIDGKRNPAILAARQYRDNVMRWSELYGLTPVTRGRVTQPAEARRTEGGGILNGEFRRIAG